MLEREPIIGRQLTKPFVRSIIGYDRCRGCEAGARREENSSLSLFLINLERTGNRSIIVKLIGEARALAVDFSDGGTKRQRVDEVGGNGENGIQEERRRCCARARVNSILVPERSANFIPTSILFRGETRTTALACDTIAFAIPFP